MTNKLRKRAWVVPKVVTEQKVICAHSQLLIAKVLPNLSENPLVIDIGEPISLDGIKDAQVGIPSIALETEFSSVEELVMLHHNLVMTRLLETDKIEALPSDVEVIIAGTLSGYSAFSVFDYVASNVKLLLVLWTYPLDKESAVKFSRKIIEKGLL